MALGTEEIHETPETAQETNGTTEVTPDRVEKTQKLKSNSKELEASEPEKPDSPFDGSDIPGVGLMYALGTLTPFHNLFLSFANGRFGGAKQHLRVANMIKAHPVLYTWCRCADFSFRVLVTLTLFSFLTVIVAAGVYKLFLADIIPEILGFWAEKPQ